VRPGGDHWTLLKAIRKRGSLHKESSVQAGFVLGKENSRYVREKGSSPKGKRVHPRGKKNQHSQENVNSHFGRGAAEQASHLNAGASAKLKKGETEGKSGNSGNLEACGVHVPNLVGESH